MKENIDIQKLAGECLGCKNPQCKTGCPVSTNIPEFIQCIKNNEFESAYRILQSNNVMSEICSKICPTENQCMGKCIKGIKSNPVQINKLEQFVNDWAKRENIVYEIEKENKNNIKIAIIGAGPAGIACGVELVKKGYDVTIYEKEKKIGGVLEYEIPTFRLKKEKIEKIEKRIKDLGIKVKTGIEFGKDIQIEDLYKNGYKAIFFAIGAYVPSKYNLSHEHYDNIYTANELLRKYHNKEKIKNLGKAVVIGGGNVAIDAARSINKNEKETPVIVYRRNKELMPAIKTEIEDAIKEGVEFIYNTKVIKAYGKNSKIEKIECIKTKIEENKVIDIEESNFELKANSIVFAIGLGIDEKFLEKLKIEHENGLVKVDENYMTNAKGIFAGGDLVEKRPTVCKAIATGKKAAIGIDTYIKNGT